MLLGEQMLSVGFLLCFVFLALKQELFFGFAAALLAVVPDQLGVGLIHVLLL